MIIIQYFRNWRNRQDFRVEADQVIYKVYGIVDEDLDDLVLHVADKYGKRPPDDTSYWSTPAETPGDVARFFPEK